MQICFLVCLLIGIGLRCTNAAHKVYWHDEVLTTIRVLGHQEDAIKRHVLENSVVTASELQEFQQFPEPKRWRDTWLALTSHPEHPPLFYLLERLWVGIFTPSVVAFRSLAILFSLGSLPLTYWLCKQLWHDHWTGLIATCLMALSPVQLLYAQEAREYSLWACLILLASGCLLRAMRGAWYYTSDASAVRLSQRTVIRQWVLYSISLTLMFYTTLLSVLVVLSHAIYVVISGSRQQWQRWAIAVVSALLLFSPWMIVIVQGTPKLATITDWTSFDRPLGQLIKFWGLHLSSSVVDFGLPLETPYMYLVPPIVLTLLLVALWQLLFVTPPTTMAFCIMALMVPTLGVILPDLINGGQLSINTHYFMPSLLIVILIIAGWLQQLLFSEHHVYRFWGQGIFMTLLIVGLVSGTLSAASFTWWNKNTSYYVNVIGDVVRQAQKPLVVSELGPTGLGNTISLSYMVDPETEFLVFRSSDLPTIPTGYSDYLIPYPSEKLLNTITVQTGRAVSPVGGDYPLWRLD